MMTGGGTPTAAQCTAPPRRKHSIGSNACPEKRSGRPLLQHAGLFAVSSSSPRSMCSSNSRATSQEPATVSSPSTSKPRGVQMPTYGALLEELLAHATGNSSIPTESSPSHRKWDCDDVNSQDAKTSGLDTFLTATIGGSEYAEDDEEAWLRNMCNVVGGALKRPLSSSSQTTNTPERSDIAANIPKSTLHPEVSSMRSSTMSSPSTFEAVAPETGMQNHMPQSVANSRCSPPLAPGGMHRCRQPRPKGQGQRSARRSSASETPVQSPRSQARERLIAEQLKFDRQPKTSCSQPREESEKASTQGQHTPRQRRLCRIGSIYKVPGNSYVLENIAARAENLCDCSIDRIPSHEWSQVFGSGGLDALPASELSDIGRAAVAAWARGAISGERFLLELETAAPLTAGAFTNSTGRPQWHTLAAVCGLAGSNAFVPSSGIFASTSGKTPQTILHEAIRSVRKEAALDNGPITIEELHLSLRALELRARSAEDRACENRSESSGARLKVQAWRELLRTYIATGKCPEEEEEEASQQQNVQSLAQVLTHALSLGSAGVEQEARALALDSLRTAPALWEECISVLSAMSRSLKEDLEIVQSLSAYAMLGIQPDASDSDIKKAYRDQCLLYHPDKGGDTATFQELQRAYEKVIDDRKRGIRPPSYTAKEQSQERCSEKQSRTTSGTPRAHGTQAEHTKTTGAREDGFPDVFAPETDEMDSEATDKRAAAAEIAAQARAAELLLQVEHLCNLAKEAADRTRAARNACEAASSVIIGASRHTETTCSSQAEKDNVGMLDAYLAAREAGPALLTAARAVAEGTGATATALSEVSVRLLPASGPISDGERAEELMSAATQCTLQANDTENIALSCEHMADEIADMLTTLGQTANEMELDSECAQLALHVLASTTKRALEVISAATSAADIAARLVHQILGIARGVARASGNTAKPTQPRHQRPPSERWQNTPQTTEDGTPPRMPHNHVGKAEATHLPYGSPNRNSPESRQSSRAQSRERCAKEAGGGTPRGGSMSGRARTDALVQRRLKLFEELERLNGDVRTLQTNLLNALKRCPPLLPVASNEQHQHLFNVIGEYLLEAVDVLKHAPESMDLIAELPRLLPWLPTSNSFDGSALSDARFGILRLGSLLDIEALASILLDQFLPMLLTVRPTAPELQLRNMVAHSVQVLRSWISAKPQ